LCRAQQVDAAALGVSILRRWIMWGAVSLATQCLNPWLATAVAQRVAQLLVVAVPAIVFFAVPATIVTIWLALFWALEMIEFVALRPFSPKKVKVPRCTWRMS
jgi:hypothetical protein